ncbi:MAG: hypothetical protein E7092_02490, partial [Bacteroidales bacterium]|nr:hypothetical protein [Bacteroidales bacterium]
MVRIVLMYYLNMQTFFNKPEEDLKLMLIEAAEPPPEETLNSYRGLVQNKSSLNSSFSRS